MANPLQQQLNEILKKEMSRKEFLTTLGFGLLSLIGVSSLIQLLSQKQRTQRTVNLDYGSSAYGGEKRQ